MGVCPTGDGSITPFVAKYCTALGFDLDMARTMSAQELICAMSAKLNEVIKATNDATAAVAAMEAEWENVKDTFAPKIQEAVNDYFAGSEFKALLKSTVDQQIADAELAVAYETVGSMANDTSIAAGAVVKTLGYRVKGDGGGSWYTISSTGPANGMDVISCMNGLFAHLAETSVADPRKFGAYGDGTSDDTAYVARAYAVGDMVEFSPGRYLTNAVALSKPTDMADGAWLVFGGSAMGSWATVAGSNLRFGTLNFDANGTRPKNCLSVSGSHNVFNTVNVRNVSYNGNSDTPNRGVMVEGSHNLFHSVNGENFTQSSSGNDSCPQVYTTIGASCTGNHADKVTGKSTRSVVVFADGGSNTVGEVVARDCSDNGVYCVRGGNCSVGSVFYSGTDEAVAVITDEEAEEGAATNLSVGTITVTDGLTGLRIASAGSVTVGTLTVAPHGQMDTALFITSENVSSGPIEIGNLVVSGKVGLVCFMPHSRGTVESLTIGHASVNIETYETQTWQNFFDVGAASALSIGGLDIMVSDAANVLTANSILRMYVYATLPSHVGNVNFLCRSQSGDNLSATFAIENNSQVLSCSNGVIQNSLIRHQSGLATPTYPIRCAKVPTSGYHNAGELVFNTGMVNNSNLAFICTESGTPGTWATLQVTKN